VFHVIPLLWRWGDAVSFVAFSTSPFVTLVFLYRSVSTDLSHVRVFINRPACATVTNKGETEDAAPPGVTSFFSSSVSVLSSQRTSCFMSVLPKMFRVQLGHTSSTYVRHGVFLE
jgi:hypothetical protein